MFKTKILASAFIASMFVVPTTGFADGGGISIEPNCKVGYVYSKKKKKCVRKRSEIFPDQILKEQGWSLAYAGKFEAAIELFELAADQSDPEVLNGLGYNNRKLGRLETGFSYYKKALAINPDYILAREYLGEGYVAAGRINLAKLQLEEIAKRCGSSCKEYKKLAMVIETGSSASW